MTRSSHSRPPDGGGRQRLALARWLEEWTLDQALRAATPAAAPDAPVRRPSARPSPATAAPPKPGDIRLLRPATADEQVQRPLYVLLLEELSDGRFLLVPFSRFSVPAVPGEWRTGLKARPLRVLCLWNARPAPASLVEAAWPASRISPDGLLKALAIRSHLSDPSLPRPSRDADFGPPLRHPLDPRHAYLSEEATLLDEHLLATVAPSLLSTPPLVYEEPSSTIRLAAESRAKYGRRKKPGPKDDKLNP